MTAHEEKEKRDYEAIEKVTGKTVLQSPKLERAKTANGYEVIRIPTEHGQPVKERIVHRYGI